MCNAVIVFLGTLLCVHAQYGAFNPAPLGFVPIYLPNATHNVTRNQNCNNNSSCLPPNYDVQGSHSLFKGCVLRNSTLLYSEIIDKPGRYFSIREKDIEYPGKTPPGYVRNHKIAAIRCYDLKGRDQGGYASILSGGVGQTHVRIHLYTMKWNRPLNFRVEIYG